MRQRPPSRRSSSSGVLRPAASVATLWAAAVPHGWESAPGGAGGSGPPAHPLARSRIPAPWAVEFRWLGAHPGSQRLVPAPSAVGDQTRRRRQGGSSPGGREDAFRARPLAAGVAGELGGARSSARPPKHTDQARLRHGALDCGGGSTSPPSSDPSGGESHMSRRYYRWHRDMLTQPGASAAAVTVVPPSWAVRSARAR